MFNLMDDQAPKESKKNKKTYNDFTMGGKKIMNGNAYKNLTKTKTILFLIFSYVSNNLP